MRINPFRPRPTRVPVLAIGMTVEFDGKRWTISAETDYYTDAVSLLLEPVKARGPLDD
jgi:hypothetical protein